MRGCRAELLWCYCQRAHLWPLPHSSCVTCRGVSGLAIHVLHRVARFRVRCVAVSVWPLKSRKGPRCATWCGVRRCETTAVIAQSLRAVWLSLFAEWNSVRFGVAAPRPYRQYQLSPRCKACDMGVCAHYWLSTVAWGDCLARSGDQFAANLSRLGGQLPPLKVVPYMQACMCVRFTVWVPFQSPAPSQPVQAMQAQKWFTSAGRVTRTSVFAHFMTVV